MIEESGAGRIAWVTGAGSGLGRAIARRLAERGWTVAASARTARDLDSLAAEVPGRITAFQLDVTHAAAAEATGRLVASALGPVDLAVLNAGGAFRVSADDFSVANFRRTVELNLLGVVNCMGPLVPAMRRRRAGHIAIMGSVAGFVGLPQAAPYSATKAALNAMAEAFRPDFERYGIAISIINPGFVRTPMTQRNRFPMPFLMDVEPAAARIVAGLERGRYEIAFPWPMVFGTRLLRAAPHWLKFAVTRRLLPR